MMLLQPIQLYGQWARASPSHVARDRAHYMMVCITFNFSHSFSAASLFQCCSAAGQVLQFMSTLVHFIYAACVILLNLMAPCGCHVEVLSGWIHIPCHAMPCHARPGLSSLAEGVNTRARTKASTRCTYCQGSPCLWPPQSGGVPALLGSGAGMECSSRPAASLSGDLHTQHALASLAD